MENTLYNYSCINYVYWTQNSESICEALKSYPLELEEELLQAVDEHNLIKMQYLIRHFFEKMQQKEEKQQAVFIHELLMQIARKVVRMKSGYDWNQMIQEAMAQTDLIELENYIKQLLLDNMVVDKTAEHPFCASNHELVCMKIHDYIEAAYMNSEISVTQMADMTNYSPNYLRQIFKQYYNISISKFMQKTRMNHAKRLLKDTDYTIKMISQMVGYEQYNYFYATFKKHTGMTAENFRRSDESVA